MDKRAEDIYDRYFKGPSRTEPNAFPEENIDIAAIEALKEDINSFVRYDLQECHRSRQAYVSDCEKMTNYLSKTLDTLISLTSRVKTLEQRILRERENKR